MIRKATTTDDRDRDAVAERAAESVLEQRRRARARRARRCRSRSSSRRSGTAEMYSLIVVELLERAGARRAEPSSRISSRRARRERTSAYSAITKNALIATSSAARMSSSAFTRSASPRASAQLASGRRVRRPRGRWPRYFGRGSSSSSSDADGPTVASGSVGSERARRGAQAARRSRAASSKSASREAALGVGGERQPHLVPAVHEDVGVVVGRLGASPRRGRRTRSPRRSPSSLRSRTIASPSRRQLASRREALLDLGVARACHRRQYPARGVRDAACDREPRAPRHRAAVRARAGRRGRRASRTSATTRRAALELPQRHARRAAAGLARGEIDAAVRERTAARRGDLRARRATLLARARARPDRHPGAVPGVRGLLRRGRASSPSELPTAARR